jgi:hypothetical protein
MDYGGRIMLKLSKIFYDKTGVFINPITIKPKFIYVTVKSKFNRGAK